MTSERYTVDQLAAALDLEGPHIDSWAVAIDATPWNLGSGPLIIYTTILDRFLVHAGLDQVFLRNWWDKQKYWLDELVEAGMLYKTELPEFGTMYRIVWGVGQNAKNLTVKS